VGRRCFVPGAGESVLELLVGGERQSNRGSEDRIGGGGILLSTRETAGWPLSAARSTAPVGSLTVPVTLPEVPLDWAVAGGAQRKTEKSAMQIEIAARRRYVRIDDLRIDGLSLGFSARRRNSA
jgi:hypothetical protein